MKNFKISPPKAPKAQPAFELPTDYFEFSKQAIIQQTIGGQTLPADYFQTLPEAIIAKRERQSQSNNYPWYYPISAAAVICIGVSIGLWQQGNLTYKEENALSNTNSESYSHITEYILNENNASGFMGTLDDDLLQVNYSPESTISFNSLIEQTDTQQIDNYFLNNNELSLEDYDNYTN